VPAQNEQVTAEACTAAWTLGPSGDSTTRSYTPAQMVLDSAYVYVLADVGPFSGQAILRASR
jgi:hypothetical protein